MMKFLATFILMLLLHNELYCQIPAKSSPILAPVAFKTPDPNVAFTCWRVCESALRDSLCTIAKEKKGSEVVVFALQREDKNNPALFELVWLSIGKKVFAKPHISLNFRPTLQQRVAIPFAYFSQQDKLARKDIYSYEPMSGLERLEAIRRMQGSSFPEELTLKQALMRISDFAYANIHIISSHSVGRRIAEKLSPALQRTDELFNAETLCPNTYGIIQRIAQKRPIPAEMLEEKECETVRNFYAHTYDTNRIESAVLVYEQKNIFSAQIPPSRTRQPSSKSASFLGSVGIRVSSSPEHSDRNFLRNMLQNPPETGTMTFAELAEIPTKEYQTNAEGKKEFTNASIQWTETKNLLEFVQEQDLAGDSGYLGMSNNHILELRRQEAEAHVFLKSRIARELWGK